MGLTPDNEPPIDVAAAVEATWIDSGHGLHATRSTNDTALVRAAHSPAGESELFVAEDQTQGRGRSGAAWWSPRGGLAFSVLTRELRMPTDRLARSSLAVGVALCEALEAFAPTAVQLKWPNDVFAEGRKLCGVLIESPASTPRRLVIGVGVNVNNSAADAPGDLRNTAIGLVDLATVSPHGAPPRFDRTEVLIACVEQIGARLAMVERGDPQLAEDWRARSLLTGRRVRVELPTEEVVGTVDTIADDGALVVDTGRGVVRCYGGTVANW